MYVDATNLFIKAQSHSLNSLKNYIFFLNRKFRQKEVSADLKQQKLQDTKCCKATNALSSLSLRTVSPPLKRDVCATLYLLCCLYP